MYEALFEVFRGIEKVKPEEFERITSNAISTMKEIGLSECEAKAYVYLFVSGYGSVELIASMAGLPRTSAYRTFHDLEKKGLIVAIGEKPRVYRVLPPEMLASNLAAKIVDAFHALEKYRFLLEDTKQNAVQRISQEALAKNLKHLIEGCEHELIISTPNARKLLRQIKAPLEHVLKRNVRVYLRAERNLPLPGVVLLIANGIKTLEVVADRQRMLFTNDWKNFYLTAQQEFIEHVVAGWGLGEVEEPIRA